MTGRSYSIGTTRRTQAGTADRLGPIEHADTGHQRTPHGKTSRAVCGAGVYFAGAPWNPDRPRACRRCRAELGLA